MSVCKWGLKRTAAQSCLLVGSVSVLGDKQHLLPALVCVYVVCSVCRGGLLPADVRGASVLSGCQCFVGTSLCIQQHPHQGLPIFSRSHPFFQQESVVSATIPAWFEELSVGLSVCTGCGCCWEGQWGLAYTLPTLWAHIYCHGPSAVFVSFAARVHLCC